MLQLVHWRRFYGTKKREDGWGECPREGGLPSRQTDRRRKRDRIEREREGREKMKKGRERGQTVGEKTETRKQKERESIIASLSLTILSLGGPLLPHLLPHKLRLFWKMSPDSAQICLRYITTLHNKLPITMLLYFRCLKITRPRPKMLEAIIVHWR